MKARWLLALVGMGCANGAEELVSTIKGGTAHWSVPTADCAPATFYEDLDGDGYGLDGTAVEGETCRPPDRHALMDGDCNDRASSVHPGAPEICDALDNDCDGAVDDEDDHVTDSMLWYLDEDGDGYGIDSEFVATGQCAAPPSASLLAGDCDDAEPAAHPGRSEDLTDGVDNDCDGLTDLRGELVGTWTVSRGEGMEPGVRSCEVPWAIEGRWDLEPCPDCMLSFRSLAENATGAVETGCEWVLDEPSFFLQAIDNGSSTYLALTVLQLGYGYSYSYSYYYGYYSYYTLVESYETVRFPDTEVEWDGQNLRFELGIFDEPYETEAGMEYHTLGWRFEGVVE